MRGQKTVDHLLRSKTRIPEATKILFPSVNEADSPPSGTYIYAIGHPAAEEFIEMATASGDTPPQNTESTATGVCIECALRRHDFRELIEASESGDALPMVRLPRAFIDGKTHVMLSSVWTHQETCAECGRKAANLYIPTR